VPRADPKTLTEALRVKIAQPFALPGACAQDLSVDAIDFHVECTGQLLTEPAAVGIACSQRSGRVKNASGDITTNGTPCSSSVSHAPINPMSWYKGSQLIPTSCEPISNPCAITRIFASKFACQPECRPMISDYFLHAAANLGRIICAPLACEVSAWARPVVSRPRREFGFLLAWSSAFPCKRFDALFNRAGVDQNPDGGIK
jgi:hypothetical protein